MKYSREDIEAMYVDYLQGYQRILILLVEQQKQKGFDIKYEAYHEFFDYEQYLIDELSQDDEKLTLEDAIEESRMRIQRLIQMLCNPVHMIFFQKWAKVDLFMELKKIQTSSHILCALEFERWLRDIVKKGMKRRHIEQNINEKLMQKKEERDLLKRYNIQKKLRKAFFKRKIFCIVALRTMMQKEITSMAHSLLQLAFLYLQP